MTAPQSEHESGWARGKVTRACQSLPPLVLEPELTDEGPSDEVWSVGAARRVCTSLPPVRTEQAEGVPALVLHLNGDPARHADAVADALLAVLVCDRTAGGAGFTRDRARETQTPGVFTLVLVPNGPTGPETEARLREVARQVASATVSTEVVPAA